MYALSLALALAAATPEAPTKVRVEAESGQELAVLTPPAKGKTGDRLMYTTYFYTAAEAVIHGYEANTNVRIVSLSDRGTVYSGVVGAGEVKLVPTGAGVFGFLTDKKASVLVGTPSSCTAVGYFVKNQDGSFKANQFYAQLPSSVSAAGARLIVWAYEDVQVSIFDRTGDKDLFRGKIAAGKFHTFDNVALGALSSHVLDIRADKPAITVQVYYDEGFVVPGKEGRASGRTFYTYVGDITEGVNDLQLISYHSDAKVLVEDIESGEPIWSGMVKRGGIHAITLSKRYVRVTADREISVGVGPFIHYGAGYAEHHFSMGAEGTGIENDFLVTTPGELWIFSYFKDVQVTVKNAQTGKDVWSGVLSSGQVQGLTPGFGMFSVKSSKGISVMGGSSSCGGEYSPAAGMFAVDETLFKVVREIREERREQAASQGRVLSEAEANAPLSPAELKRAAKSVSGATGRKDMSDEEIQQRVEDMVVY
jgi:hypothetical protein